MFWKIILAILIIWVIVMILIAAIAVLGAKFNLWIDEDIDEWEDPEDIV